MVGESPAVEMMLSSGGEVVFTIPETKDTEKVLLSSALSIMMRDLHRMLH